MELSLWEIFLTVVVAHFVALLSPGPDFVLIVKSAIKYGGKKSVGVAAGIAFANGMYIFLCLIGVGAILASSATLLIIMKILGGLFLIYLAIQALCARKSDYQSLALRDTKQIKVQTTWAREFVTGFMSGILNPKNLLFYLSLFTIVLTENVNMTFRIGLGIWMTSLVFIWNVLIIYTLSVPKVRNQFTRFSYYIDKVTGTILGLIGFSIIKSTMSNK
ncbi:LysE family transporter [Pasteurella skyensis]|uniref:LysE family transporter n=1 Tax=Phocoenobacter skyensis TaxID=97481 RepID=A0AAJ6NBT2_9PAST|nr:LysE family transporter [Pasteurella skyensis]MDP8171109.1 LysE family transporter [Pasteurella skyensis]MDP8173860.1 LysE family transporter [Pasteurella skyensis]